MRRTLLAILLTLGPGVRAAPVPDVVKDSVGEWLVVTDDGKPGCRITLAAEPASGAWRATPGADCAARLPAVGRATAWDDQGGVRLFGTDRTLLLAFGEDETTVMKMHQSRWRIASSVVGAREGFEAGRTERREGDNTRGRG